MPAATAEGDADSDTRVGSPSSRRGLRILMIAPQPFFRPRGTPFSVLHRIRALTDLGHRVDLVTYPFGEEVQMPGLRVLRAAPVPGVRDVGIGPSLPKLLLDVPLFRKAWRLGTRGDYDLLHTHEEGCLLGAALGRFRGLPHLYDMHSSLPEQLENFGRYGWRPVVRLFEALERSVLRRSAAVIAICPELGERVRKLGYGGVLEVIENTLALPPVPLDPEREAQLRSVLGLTGRRAIVYTGSLEPYQGIGLLLEAARRMRAEEPPVRFLIVGGSAVDADRVRARAERMGVTEVVRVASAVPPEQVPHYQRLADVLVTARTRGTNTPLKIYEYLRARRPIVATNVRAHTQVLNATCAEIVPPDPDALAEGLRRVLRDPAHAARLRDGAARLAAERYSESVYMEKMARLLDRLALRPARRV